MLTAFPAPVLSVAADAVRDLEGRDALSGLWTLFTKCKESLQDGRRLENISWRLWYREMMRDNLVCHQEEKEKEELQEPNTPTNLYRPPTPSEAEPPPYAVQDDNQPTSSPTFSSSRLGPAQDSMFRSISIAEEAQYPSLDSSSASLQMSKSKPDTVLFPVVPAQPYSLSTLSSRSRDIAPMTPHVRASMLQPQLKSYAGTPVCVGKIIYDMLPCSLQSPLTPTGPLNPTTVSIHTPPLPSTSSTPNSRYTSLHAPPPSPSLSDSYARAHPTEVDVTRLDVGLGPLLSVSISSPSSPQVLGNTHISWLSSNSQLPPRLVVVNPTPNLSPHPTPPASPLLDSASPPSTSPSSSNGFGGTKGNWLTLPSSHHCNRMQDPHDRSRSDDSASVPFVVTTAVTTTGIDLLSFLQPPPPPPLSYHQNIGEDQHPTSESFVQDRELSLNSNPNRRSISSITTFVSTTDSAISTVTEATSVFIDETSQVEEHMKDDSRWLDRAVVVGSPADVLIDVDVQPMSKTGGTLRLRLDSLSTIHSMSVRKGGDEDGDGESDVLTSDLDTDLEEMGGGRREGLSAGLTHTIAAATKKKKIGMMKKLKTKTKPLKRTSLKSPTSTLSPPPSATALHQSISSSLTNRQQRDVLPVARRPSNGRSSSRSMSRSGRSSVGIRTNSSVSRSRSHENRGVGESSLGMTVATRTAIKKPVLAVSTKFKNRRFMSGLKGKGGSNGKGSGSTMIRRESSGGSGTGGGAEEDGVYEEKEKESERTRERMLAMELIQMQRHHQSLIQQRQQQLEMNEREEEKRTLVAQLALRDAEVKEAEIRRQRQRHHQEEQQQQQENEIQGGTNGLLGVSLKRPVRFNFGSNSDEGSGVGSHSKSGSEFSGIEQLMVPLVDPIVNGKGKERDEGDAGVLGQEVRQQEQEQQSVSPQPHQLGIAQQQQTVSAPHSHPHHHHQQLKTDKQPERRDGEQVAEYRSEKKGKGKERDHSNPNASSKPRSTSKANNHHIHRPPPKDSTHGTLSSALAAKVKHTLSDPLLPGQHKRTIVLTSESEFEDSADDGSWSSEEMGSEDDEELRKEEQQRQDQLLAQQQQRQLQQQQLEQLQQRPPPVQRTHPSNQPPNAHHNQNHNHNPTHTANRTQRTVPHRGHRHPPHPAHAQALMAQAAHEAQRQRDMFAKKPTESFQNLTQVARTQSVGLLTQLMNPDPEIFPVGHPYRRGYSSSEIKGVGGGSRGARPLQPARMEVKANNTQDNKSEEPPSASRPATHRKSSSSSTGADHSRVTATFSPPARTLSMQTARSTAAMPVSSQVQAGSVNGKGGHGLVNGLGMANVKKTVNGGHSTGGYRPKGPPQDQELEDESASDGESGSGIQLSKSVAQQKLKALAERRGIVAHGNGAGAGGASAAPAVNPALNQKTQGDEDDVPQWAKVSRPPPTRTRSEDQYSESQVLNPNGNRRSLNGFHLSQMIASGSTNHASPIPVVHPYNLPPPAPPSTPRTTRRLMLSTELSESLRRNLLWERQVSKVNLAAVRRTASGGGSRHSLLGGGVQPLTTGPSMVQLHPKGTLARLNSESAVRRRQEESGGGGVQESGGDGDGPGPGPSVHHGNENDREQRMRLAMARNRSWANDYHFSGW